MLNDTTVGFSRFFFSFFSLLCETNAGFCVCALDDVFVCRYFSVTLWKFSDTEPKQTSGFSRPRDGPGQREALRLYFRRFGSSRERHISMSCGVQRRLKALDGRKVAVGSLRVQAGQHLVQALGALDDLPGSERGKHSRLFIFIQGFVNACDDTAIELDHGAVAVPHRQIVLHHQALQMLDDTSAEDGRERETGGGVSRSGCFHGGVDQPLSSSHTMEEKLLENHESHGNNNV
ncbi:hypothetical protein EYF80_023767 [Liparis tanakae]|uniref:Uncharacterized protein n=1 Tax=Liparis tanakae TaxID=230148 RepID=A0A4Z2HK94_9TELE|nr:hypothetical protein EYF80_023767 [Liparis tanakae]